MVRFVQRMQPLHNTSSDILRMFAGGTPLNSEQLNFLAWHEHELSNAQMDPVLRYYLEQLKRKKRKYYANSSFLLPHEELNPDAIKQLKERIQQLIRLRQQAGQRAGVTVPFTQKQFTQFRHYGAKELIFWLGNQFLTGSSFYPGGIPPLILFRWGNLFGIAKMYVLNSPIELTPNLLVHFEDRRGRELADLAKNFQYDFSKDIQIYQGRELMHNYHLQHAPAVPMPNNVILSAAKDLLKNTTAPIKHPALDYLLHKEDPSLRSG